MTRCVIIAVVLWLLAAAPPGVLDVQAETAPHLQVTKSESAKPAPPAGPQVPQNVFAALNSGDLGYFGSLLENGADPNTRDPKSGCTLLMLAGKAAMAEMLLNHGADPMLKDKQGATALHHAVTRGDALGIIPHLLNHGADINAKAIGWLQQTPFMVARRHFFQNNPSFGTKIMELLASNGAEVDAADESGYTVLISAVVNDKPELVSLMIELGADVNLQAKDGLTAMGWAHELGFVDIIELLEAAQPY